MKDAQNGLDMGGTVESRYLRVPFWLLHHLGTSTTMVKHKILEISEAAATKTQQN